MNGHSFYVFLWSYDYQVFFHLIVKYFTLGNCRLVCGQPLVDLKQQQQNTQQNHKKPKVVFRAKSLAPVASGAFVQDRI